MDKHVKTTFSKTVGIMSWKTVVYQKLKKCYVYITFPDFTKFYAALSNKFLKENSLFGTSVKGVMFVCDEKLIAEIVKAYFKYIGTKALTRDIGYTVDAKTKAKFSNIEITIVGKCNSFSKNNIQKESTKLTKLNEFVSKIEIKKRNDIQFNEETCLKTIVNTQSPNLKSTIALGAWYIPFEFRQTEIDFYEHPGRCDSDTFKNIIKFFGKKLSHDALKTLYLCVSKLHGLNNGDLEFDITKTNDAASAYKNLLKIYYK